ncbi:hypothetical protein WJX81_006189 [Elliptochloris bilobata]|uniref:cGMP-dependent protein kinase n=1 Tax=Elliptochloris bilobata TaxID=381761 RepID=A0AAW1SEE5_9CHLO
MGQCLTKPKPGALLVEEEANNKSCRLLCDAGGGVRRLLHTDQTATVSASIALQGLAKVPPACCGAEATAYEKMLWVASPRKERRQGLDSQAGDERAVLVDEPSSEEDEVIDFEVAARIAAGPAGTPGCGPTEEEALVLAEVLQRDLVLRDADPTALSQLVRRMQRVALPAGGELPPPLNPNEGRIIVLLRGTAVRRFCQRHSATARRLRFLRKVPPLCGLADEVLLAAAAGMTEHEFKDGQALLCGADAASLWLVRHGCVRARLQDGSGASVLGRGHIVGSRTLVDGKLRRVACEAIGPCQAVALPRAVLDALDAPQLAGMLDLEAADAALQALPLLRGTTPAALEAAADLFQRQSVACGEVLALAGRPLERVIILRSGELASLPARSDAIVSAGNASVVGGQALQNEEPSSATVSVVSETAALLVCSRAALRGLVAAAASAAAAALPEERRTGEGASPRLAQEYAAAAAATLRHGSCLQVLMEEEIRRLAAAFDLSMHAPGDVVATTDAAGSGCIVMVASGASVAVPPDVIFAPGERLDSQQVARLEGMLLRAGEAVGRDALVETLSAQAPASLVVMERDTQVLTLSRAAADAALGQDLRSLVVTTMAGSGAGGKGDGSPIRFQDLELRRIIGTGQFGTVRIVLHRPTGEVYALKALPKAALVEAKQVEHAAAERRLLAAVDSPFCARLARALQDEQRLYLLMEYVPGGELFRLLEEQGCLGEPAARFYAACALAGLAALHRRGIIYRDLKPENLLLGADGYLKLVDFGFAKHIGTRGRTFTICGTPDYQAPEVIQRRGTGLAADWWALGVLIYEMLVGSPPFKSCDASDHWDTFRQALSGRFDTPPHVSAPAADLIRSLLQVDPELRLGARGPADVRGHAWFAGFDWGALEAHALAPPLLPRVKRPLDARNFAHFDSPRQAASARAGDARASAKWEDWDWLQGLSVGKVLNAVISEAKRAGLLVMLDMHHLAMADGITELWYNEKYPEANLLLAWATLVKRYARHWNVFAVDLKNEPHGHASWGTGDLATDWRLAAERIGAAILACEPRLLVFVEGVGGNCCPVPTQQPAFWGGALDSAAAAPVRLPVAGKLVYSPHVYGPDVHMQSYFRSERFPDSLPGGVWEAQWAHLASASGPALVLGEWGGFGRAGSADRAWQERLAAFLVERGMTDNFFWCLNPNSVDTGGVLEDDWTTPVRDKLERLARINTCPSRLEVDSSGNFLRLHSRDSTDSMGKMAGGLGKDAGAEIMSAQLKTR